MGIMIFAMVANIMMPMVRPYITASRVMGLLFMKNRVVTPLWMKMGFTIIPATGKMRKNHIFLHAAGPSFTSLNSTAHTMDMLMMTGLLQNMAGITASA